MCIRDSCPPYSWSSPSSSSHGSSSSSSRGKNGSSTGGACHHVDHVNTQLPYAVTAAALATVGFITTSFLPSGWLVLALSLALFFVVTKFLHAFWNDGVPEAQMAQEHSGS